jgi:hypothetical protein
MKKHALSFLILYFFIFSAGASSVRSVSMAELAEKSAVVFEGSVAAVVAHKNDRGQIVTDVLFDVVDVIKGELSTTQLRLTFLGGEFEGEVMLISDIHYPQQGEKGIYFVESVDTPLVNPLYGWDQGRFLLTKDKDGVERVLTANDKPVADIEKTHPQLNLPTQMNESVTPNDAISTGIAKGVSLSQSTPPQKGLSKEDFKQEIRNLTGQKP